MVFSSDVPAIYLDPSNWEQQKITNQASDPVLQIPASGPGSIKPGSMVDRARLAMVPLPEAGLRCPRCESTNTKFCYFNNYNLTQPRHFCKTCRRYWTRGGTLRNVPVGGSCRRNKRRKPKKGGEGSNAQTPAQISQGLDDLPPPPPPDPFMSGFNHLNGYGSGFGLNWGGGGEVEFETTGASRSVEQLTGLLSGSSVSGSGLYPFYESNNNNNSSGFGEVARAMKVEENHQGLSLSKNLMVGGFQGYGLDHNQYSNWPGAANAWIPNNSGFHSSSSSGRHDEFSLHLKHV